MTNEKNRFQQALYLPKICNLNPRSLYNKIEEFQEFVIQEEIDIAFISESWERKNLELKDLIKLEDFQVIANVNQRKEIGGRPAIVANKRKFDIQNLTNSEVQVPFRQFSTEAREDASTIFKI